MAHDPLEAERDARAQDQRQGEFRTSSFGAIAMPKERPEAEKEERRRGGAPHREKAHPRAQRRVLAVLFFPLALLLVVDDEVDSISRFAWVSAVWAVVFAVVVLMPLSC